MAKSKVKISYDLSSEEEQNSDTTASNDDDAEPRSDQEELKKTPIGCNNKQEVEVDRSDESNMEEINSENTNTLKDEDTGQDDVPEQKSGLADVMAKILRKQVPVDKPVIMSKALTDKELRLKRKIKEEQSEDLQPRKRRADDSSSDEDYGTGSRDQILKKRAWEELGRMRVDITQKDAEKTLQRTATKGVLQLFNAVAKQQKLLEDKLREVGSSERRKDHVIKSMTKGAFLDMLKATPNVCDEPVVETHKKKVVKKERLKADDDSDGSDGEAKDKPSWGILRDDFMMGAKMKDWDKDSEDEDEDMDEQGGDTDGSDDQS